MFSDVSGTDCVPIFMVLLMTWKNENQTVGFGSTTLEVGDAFSPETSENLHILTRLSAGEHFIEFCRRESLKT
jgi:hypothetical protein